MLYSHLAAIWQFDSILNSVHKKCPWHVILRPTIEESEREAVGGWCVLNLSCVLKSLKLLNIDGVVLEHLYYWWNNNQYFAFTLVFYY